MKKGRSKPLPSGKIRETNDSDIDLCFLNETPSTANAEQVSEKEHLKQNDRINRRPSVFMAVKAFYLFTNKTEIDMLEDFSKEVFLRNKILNADEFVFNLLGTGYR